MKIFEPLSRAGQFAGAQWRSAHSAGRTEESELWRYLNEQYTFIHQLGQAYQFEDYLQTLPTTPSPDVSAAVDSRQEARSRRALKLALKVLEEAPVLEYAQDARVLINLCNFLADTGQTADFEDFFDHRLDYAPLAMTSFATIEEAEAWLKEPTEPPSPCRVLVGDEYYLAWYSRTDGSRNLSRDFTIEPYIEELVARGIPATTPSFQSREEAKAWLANHPASPFGFVTIAGEYHLAVHHKRLKRHTLHPVALSLNQWEAAKSAAERPL